MGRLLHGRLLPAALIVALAIPCVVSAAPAPPKAEKMLADARVLLDRGDEAGALSKVEQAAKLAPDWAPPHASLGLLYQRLSDETAAREHFTRCHLIGLLESGAEDSRLTREIAEGEALIVYLVNAERLQRGLPALMPHVELAAVARGHSEEMATLRYFSHTSPRAATRTPSDRFRRMLGFEPPCIAENLARMASSPLWSFNPDNLHKSHARLMESENHRASILWDRPTHIGVGIAVNDRGDYWITQNFARFEP
ncbi:MAG: CAP domain-containing protein [Armatimonadota bacterium]